MAWISVHEQVIGGKLRNLAKEIGCSQNEALGILIRLWLWAINNARKDGHIVGADKGDVAEVLNIGIDRKYSPCDVVEALIATSWIDMENGLYIHDWEEWQEQWYRAIEVRERDAKRKREERSKKRMLKASDGHSPTSAEDPDEKGMEHDLPTPHLNIQHEEPPKQKPEEYTKDFEEFWEIYPRKMGKGEAYKKYKARVNDGWSESELMEAAKNYASRVSRERTEQKYIKHAKTFLSENTPFADFLPKESDVRKQASESECDEPYGEWRD